MPPQVTCVSALPVKTRKHENHTFFNELDCVTHTMHVRCLPERKIVTCDVFDSV